MLKKFFRPYLEFAERVGPLKLAAALFFALALFILVFEQPGDPMAKAQRSQKYILPQMILERVEGVDLILSGEGPTVSLRKTEEGWAVLKNGEMLPANTEAVNKLLAALSDLKEELAVSKNPGKHGIFGVDPKKGVEIRVFQEGREVGDIFAGMPEALNKQFVRKNKSDTVIEVVPAFQNLILSPAQWEGEEKEP